MSQILEKYKVNFSYSADSDGTVTMSAAAPLLAAYFNGFNTAKGAGELLFCADSILKKNGYRLQLHPTWDKSIQSLITDENVMLFTGEKENSADTAGDTFTLPLADFAEIAQLWHQFILGHKIRKFMVMDGQAVIDIIADGFANALVIKKPVAVSWPDCGGSVGEYYAVSNHSFDEQKSLTAGINHAVNNGTDNEVFNAIEVFLNLFASGNYSVTISEINTQFEAIEYDRDTTYSNDLPPEDRFTNSIYNYGNELHLFSRSYATIDKGRVAEYRQLIGDGARPKVIAYQCNLNVSSHPYYIIDGHHKLLAYIELRLPAPAIYIEREDDAPPAFKNITPQIMSFLTKVEFHHMLLNNGDTLDLSVCMTEEITQAIDEIFLEKTSVGTHLPAIIYKAHHSADQAQIDWASKRLDVLAKNKNTGNRFYLYYTTKDRRYHYKPFYIENSADFKKWKDAFLNDKDLTPDIEQRQTEISAHYYPPAKPPQPASTSSPYLRQERPARDLSEKSVWFYVRIVLIIILIIRVLAAVMR